MSQIVSKIPNLLSFITHIGITGTIDRHPTFSPSTFLSRNKYMKICKIIGINQTDLA